MWGEKNRCNSQNVRNGCRVKGRRFLKQLFACSLPALTTLLTTVNLNVVAQQRPLATPDAERNSPSRAAVHGRPIRVEVDLTLVNVTVTDIHKHAVVGLQQDSFRVFEDNIEQEVIYFSTEDIPISLGLILDVSGSMKNKLSYIRDAAVQFLKSANPRDEFFVVRFADRPELSDSFQNAQTIEMNATISPAKGRTSLLDAIYLGLSQMQNAKYTRRVLLIVSDGADNHSRYSRADIKRLLRECDCQVYAIGVFEPIWVRGRTLEELDGPSLLAGLTEVTGGRVFSVTRPDTLPDIAAKIGVILRNEYLLGYRPGNKAHDNHWRKIKIKLRPPKGSPPLTVSAKRGYYPSAM